MKDDVVARRLKESAPPVAEHVPTMAIAARASQIRSRRRMALVGGGFVAAFLLVAAATAVPSILRNQARPPSRPAAIPAPPARAIGPERLVVVDNTASSGRSVVISLNSNEEEERPEAGSGLMVANAGSSLVRAYFTEDSRSVLDVVDLETGEVSGSIELPGSLPGYMGGTYLSTLTVSPDDSVAFVQLAKPGPERSDGSIPFNYVIASVDVGNRTVRPQTASLDACGAESFLVALSRTRVAAICPEASAVNVYEIAEDGSTALEDRIAITVPADDRSDENGNSLNLDRIASAIPSRDAGFLTVFSQNGSVSVVDLTTKSVSRQTDLGLGPNEYLTLSQPAVDTDGDRAFFGVGDTRSFDRLKAQVVWEVSLTSLEEVRQMNAGLEFSVMADFLDGSLIYLVDPARGQVRKFDVDARRMAGVVPASMAEPSYLIMTGN